MKRYDIGLFFGDVRVRLVLGLVIVAILIAVFLTYLEFRFRKKQELRKAKSEEDKFTKEFLKKINSKKNPREKMDFLNETAKSFLKENFGVATNSDYSVLREKLKKYSDVAFFCDSMFEAYYSSEITDEKVNSLSQIFIELFRKSHEKEKTDKDKNSVLNKFDSLFEKDGGSFAKKFAWVGGIIFNKLNRISRLFLRKKKQEIYSDWKNNFRDENKESLLKTSDVGGGLSRMFERALMSKQNKIKKSKLKREYIEKNKIGGNKERTSLFYNL